MENKNPTNFFKCSLEELREIQKRLGDECDAAVENDAYGALESLGRKGECVERAIELKEKLGSLRKEARDAKGNFSALRKLGEKLENVKRELNDVSREYDSDETAHSSSATKTEPMPRSDRKRGADAAFNDDDDAVSLVSLEPSLMMDGDAASACSFSRSDAASAYSFPRTSASFGHTNSREFGLPLRDSDEKEIVLLLRCTVPEGTKTYLKHSLEEIQKIEAIWTKAPEKGHRRSVDVKALMSGTAEHLLTSMLTANVSIIHIAAHTDLDVFGDDSIMFVDANGVKSSIDSTLCADLLASTSRTAQESQYRRRRPALIVLNGCYSAKLAWELCKRGVEAVVAWKTEANDKAASLFGQALHRALAAGESRRDAFELAKTYLRIGNDNDVTVHHIVAGDIHVNQFALVPQNKYNLFPSGAHKGRINEPGLKKVHCRIPAGVPIFRRKSKSIPLRKCVRSLSVRQEHAPVVQGIRRDEENAAVAMCIKASNAALSSQRKSKTGICAIWGFAGVGKSELAEAVCKNDTIRRRFEYGGIFWLVASTRNPELEVVKFYEDCSRMHATLVPPVERNKKYEMDALRDVLKVHWPDLDRSPMLVVLDDLWDCENVEKLVPTSHLPPGSVILMTTRGKSIGESFHAVDQIQLKQLEPDQSYHFFSEMCASKGVTLPRKEVVALAERVKHNTLAMKILAMNLLREVSPERVGDPCEWTKILQDLEKVPDIATPDFNTRQIAEHMRRHESVFASIGLSLQRLQHKSFKKEFLQRCVDKLAIFPQDTQMSLVALKCLWQLDTREKADLCARSLVASGLLERGRSLGPRSCSYRIHDLCRDFVCYRVGEKKILQLQKDLVNFLASRDIAAIFRLGKHMNEWIVLFDSCVSMKYVCTGGTDSSGEQVVANFKGAYSEMLGNIGRLAESDRYSKESLETLEEKSSTRAHVDTARALERRGRSLFLQYRFDESHDKLQSSLKMQYDLHGPDAENDAIAKTLFLIANNLGMNQKIKKAETYCQRAIEMKKKVHEGEKTQSLFFAKMLHTLGSIARGNKDLKAAKEMYLKSLRMIYACHPDGKEAKTSATSVALHTLGWVYFKGEKNYKEALKMSEKSRDMQYEIHPDGEDAKTENLAMTHCQIGEIYYEMKNFATASMHIQRALSMMNALVEGGGLYIPKLFKYINKALDCRLRKCVSYDEIVKFCTTCIEKWKDNDRAKKYVELLKGRLKDIETKEMAIKERHQETCAAGVGLS